MGDIRDYDGSRRGSPDCMTIYRAFSGRCDGLYHALSEGTHDASF